LAGRWTGKHPVRGLRGLEQTDSNRADGDAILSHLPREDFRRIDETVLCDRPGIDFPELTVSKAGETSSDGSTWQRANASDILGYPSPFDPAWELERARAMTEHGTVLPFQPLSVRDFIVSERHNIDAASGYVRRFMPRAAPFLRGIELLTRRPPKLLRSNSLWYRQPIYYLNNPFTLVPSSTNVAVPSYSSALDYEMQLAFVIDRPLRDASASDAEKAIAAFVMLCDFSARDVEIAEMRSGTGPQKAKHFLSSMSATAVSADEVLPNWRELTGTIRVNGELISTPTTADSRYGLGDLIAHASASEELMAGEMFSIGCLAGGSGMESGYWIGRGDRLEMELPGVGRIEHLII
jgi:2-keto-4-pentenoate hydratase/2-oxohepta-3-ene-1,7-dioic acid hydratase in catechol pathway